MNQPNRPIQAPTTSVAGTTPTKPRRHSIPVRGLGIVSSAPSVEGRFGRMFRNLPVFDLEDKDLEMLAGKMIQGKEDDKNPELLPKFSSACSGVIPSLTCE